MLSDEMLREYATRVLAGDGDSMAHDLRAMAAEVLALRAHRVAVEESFKEYQHRAQLEHSRLKAQLRAYTDTVILKPFKWLALQHADPVPIPEPEALASFLDDFARLTARLAEVERERGTAMQRTADTLVIALKYEQERDRLAARVTELEAELARRA